MQHFQSIRLDSPHSGPRLIVTGAVHGNEVCGTAAIRRVLAEFEPPPLDDAIAEELDKLPTPPRAP